jgi:hypothetical protein
METLDYSMPLPFASVGIWSITLPLLHWWDRKPPPEMTTHHPAFVLSRNLDPQESSPPSVTLSRRTRLYSGRPDPADPSRFTIDYEVCGQRDTIDGQLLEAGSVTLKPRRAKLLPSNAWDNLPEDPTASTSRRPTTTPATARSH